ncbi:gametocyte-specific factor 1 homolog [Bactrocera oleae]|uniref:gametocyte-specific factor 1 homolog n=1 Tax=Bactrocera oleae TaxID=104688 RepID=UPI0006B77F1C|nr:gametocyte-specific factor 1 homolog [Bactrocera oleae]
MFSLENDNDVVECPYNPAHRLLRKRLQPHLIKCRVNYPQLELQKCPFNNTHHIPEPEFCLHVTNCPDRKLITQYKYNTAEPKEEERVSHAPIECEENWDDTEVNDYDPQKFIEKKDVLRQPIGIPPAERKEFIKTERKRLGDEESYSDSDDDFKEEVRRENSITDVIENYESKDPSSIKRIRSISPSPPRQRDRSRSRSPQSSVYYKPTHVRGSYIPSPSSPSRISVGSSSNRFFTYHIQPSPAAYNIDDDPYYNSGNGASYQRVNYSNNSSNQNPPLVAYPTRTPSYGRGAYRGYSYDRKNSSRYNDAPY